MGLSTGAGKTPKSEKKPDKKNKKGKNSFLKNLKGSLFGDSELEWDENPDHKTQQKTSSNVSVADEISKSHIKSDNTVKQENKPVNHPESDIKSKPDGPVKPDSTEKKSAKDQEDADDPTLYLFNNLKDHDKLQSLRKRKDKIIKITASIVSILLIIIGIVYSIVPNENVASNVIFGERAMFSAFLILVAFLILAAVFSRRLLEGKYLKNIHQDLEIAEGKKPKDETKNSHPDPIIERMNKKNK